MRRCLAIVVVHTCVWLCGAALASGGPTPVLDLKTYVSPSGAYRLEVDPSAQDGAGAGSYRVTRGGTVQWAADHPFTLCDAAITDDGVVAGYGYTRGLEGQPRKKDYGAVQVVILQPDVRLRLNDAIPREYDPTLHAPPKPVVNGMVLSTAMDRLIIRLRGPYTSNAEETWCVYELSSGKRLKDVHPTRPAGVSSVHLTVACALRDTPLLLQEWVLLDDSGDALFTLMDVAGHTVWTLRLPKEFVADAADGKPGATLWEPMWGGTVLSTAEPHGFELRLVRDKKRVAFEVFPDPEKPGGWKVRELTRVDFVETQADPVAALPVASLKHLGTIRLGSPGPVSPIRHIQTFDIDERGRIGFIRRDDGQGQPTFALVIVDPAGTVVREAPLAWPADARWGTFLGAWPAQQRWIVTRTTDRKPVNAAWWFDAATGELQAIAGFECPPIQHLAGNKDGGFVVVTQGEFTEDGALAFDRAGQRRWRAGRKHGGVDSLMDPEAAAIDGDGRTAIVSPFTKLIQIYDAAGKHADAIDLERVLKRGLCYPTELCRDNRGGWFVGDTQCATPVWHIDRTRHSAAVAPRYSDGRPFPFERLRADADGHLWTTDGELLLRLDDKGIVDRTLGAQAEAGALDAILAMKLDQAGRIYAVAGRTMAVHVFEPDGRPVRVLKPLGTDFVTPASSASLAIASDGAVYLFGPQPRAHQGDGVRFATAGERTINAATGTGAINAACWPQPNGPGIWEMSYQEVRLRHPDSPAIRTIKRRPDRHWLDKVQTLAVAPDGSAAVVSARYEAVGTYTRRAISLYAPDGQPLRTITLPGEGLVYQAAYDGRRVAVSLLSTILLVSIDTGEIRRFVPEGKGRAEWRAYLPPGSKELWLGQDSTLIERYALDD